jgi:hypothetical protein
VCRVSGGIRVDKLRRDSSFVIPRRRTQKEVRQKDRAGRSFRSGGVLEEEESTARIRREA